MVFFHKYHPAWEALMTLENSQGRSLSLLQIFEIEWRKANRIVESNYVSFRLHFCSQSNTGLVFSRNKYTLLCTRCKIRPPNKASLLDISRSSKARIKRVRPLTSPVARLKSGVFGKFQSLLLNLTPHLSTL